MDKPKTKNKNLSILGIFAKQPLPGKCKTRLSPPLSPQEAAEFYHRSLLETVQRMRHDDRYDLAVCYTGARSWFAEQFPDLPLLLQQGEDLGERMANALDYFLCHGYRRAVLIGSDSPDLPNRLISDAFAALDNTDVVLTPAADGGYVLIGESSHHPQLFENIAWSTPDVLPETERRLQQLEIGFRMLGEWEDLDDPESLNRFLQRSPQTETALYLRQKLVRHFSASS